MADEASGPGYFVGVSGSGTLSRVGLCPGRQDAGAEISYFRHDRGWRIAGGDDIREALHIAPRYGSSGNLTAILGLEWPATIRLGACD